MPPGSTVHYPPTVGTGELCSGSGRRNWYWRRSLRAPAARKKTRIHHGPSRSQLADTEPCRARDHAPTHASGQRCVIVLSTRALIPLWTSSFVSCTYMDDEYERLFAQTKTCHLSAPPPFLLAHVSRLSWCTHRIACAIARLWLTASCVSSGPPMFGLQDACIKRSRIKGETREGYYSAELVDWWAGQSFCPCVCP